MQGHGGESSSAISLSRCRVFRSISVPDPSGAPIRLPCPDVRSFHAITSPIPMTDAMEGGHRTH
ncbi:hypothetical protein BD310DRAFT_940986, partial [Dichomitus squalens]